MTDKPPPSIKPPPIRVPEGILRALREKDKIIKLQARRTEVLENEVDKLRKDRDSLSTKVTLLSYKLQLNQNQPRNRNVAKSSSSEGGSGPSNGSASSSALTSSPPRANGKPRSSTVGTPIPVEHARAPPSRQRSQTGVTITVQRQRSQKRIEDEEKLKRSRAWANAYELSQDLHEKQLEMLERKYGGQIRARRAARVIQNAYRQYCMTRNFAKLRSEAEEKRLSRRLGEFGRSKTIWTDMVVNVENSMGLQARSYSEYGGYHSDHDVLEDTYNSNTTTSTTSATSSHMSSSHMHHIVQSRSRTVKVMQKSHSMNTSLTSKDVQLMNRKPLQRSFGLDLSTIRETGAAAKHKQPFASPEPEANNNRNSYPELNDSSASDSPQDTPVEPVVDLPSINFENLLESKETDILVDESFQSDSSQEHPATMPRTSCPRRNLTSSSVIHVSNSLDDIVSENHNDGVLKASHGHQNGRTYENMQLQYDPTSSNTTLSHFQVHVDDSVATDASQFLHNSTDSDRTPTQDDHGILSRVYANQEVRLRAKKKSDFLTSPEDELMDSTSSLNTTTAAHSSQGKEPEASPIWKRKSAALGTNCCVDEAKRMSNISEASEPESLDGRESREGLSSSQSSDTASIGSGSGQLHTYHRTVPSRRDSPQIPVPPKVSDRQRKRLYRIGLNLFNKKPEKGIKYLMDRRFIDNRPSAVAKFLISRKGLSRQMIGEFLGNLQKPFNMEVLQCFSMETDLSGLQVDVALRQFQSHFRMPGEAQKIERLMECFASWYCQCNPDQVKIFHSTDTVFLLAFAIIMLNTDLHNKNIKQDRKMKLNDFIKNLRGLDDDEDIDRDLLVGIYERIKMNELKPLPDHVSQVLKVEQMIIGKKQLSLPHRRLVCYCRLYEVHDPNKREKVGLHQREVFLFNDMLMVTKIFSKKKNNVVYSFRQSYPLCGLVVYLFETPRYRHGIRLTTNIDGKVLIMFNARNNHDRTKFVEDLKEAVEEMNEMESLRIEEELQKQKMPQTKHSFNRHSKDSGVVDIELLKPADPGHNRLSAPECSGLKKSALSNSLIDLTEGSLRRGSGGSLDSGMASTASGCSGEKGEETVVAAPPNLPAKGMQPQQSSSKGFGIFGKKGKGASKASLASNCSEV